MIDISVIIPTHIISDDRAHIFIKALHGLLHQTIQCDRYEVIIVDDGSSILLHKTIGELLYRKHNISLISQPKKGPAAARNLGVRLAKSGIILFLGDDVVIKDNLLEEHLKAHKDHDNCILVNSVYADKNVRLGKDILETKFEGVLENIEYEIPTGGAFCTACVSIKKKLIEKEPFDENFLHAAYEDTEVGYRLYKLGVRFVYIRNTYAVHEHIHSIDSILKRSKNCGQAFAYLSRKHPQLNVGIQWKAGSAKVRVKIIFYSLISKMLNMVKKNRFFVIPDWGIKIMCNYNFAKGIKEGKRYYASQADIHTKVI